MNAPHLSLSVGRLAGLSLPPATPDAPAVNAWLGIPYAQPPVGALRWRSPQPHPGWAGVRDATRFGPDPVQAPDARLRGAGNDEDCLTLNVWAPAGAAPGSLPVMVWIFGGGFAGGAGSEVAADGARLAARGVVVVTINYRVGLFGFLAHPGLRDESAEGTAGNYGLLDQMAALRWVQAHIHAFGGDAGRVTAFGVSAGSASISLLLTAPAARGLFQQAILQSPGAARPLASLDEAMDAGLALGPDIGALRALPAHEVLARTALLNPKVRGLTTPRVLRPIRDGVLLAEDERPALHAGRFAAMPMIVGTNADEGSSLTRTWPVDDLPACRALIEANFGAFSAEALRAWPAATDAQARSAIAAAFADTQFNYGARLLAHRNAAQGQPTWRYLFTRRVPGDDGPHHADEVPYVFGTLREARAMRVAPTRFEADEAVSQVMMDAWVRFARTGSPASEALPWPDARQDRDALMELGDAPSMRRGWRDASLDLIERYFSATDA